MNSDFKLHEENEPKPPHLASSAVTCVLDTKSETIRITDMKRPINWDRAILRGIVAVCDRCGRWQEMMPCELEDLEQVAASAGWKDDEDGKNLCPVCAAP